MAAYQSARELCDVQGKRLCNKPWEELWILPALQSSGLRATLLASFECCYWSNPERNDPRRRSLHYLSWILGWMGILFSFLLYLFLLLLILDAVNEFDRQMALTSHDTLIVSAEGFYVLHLLSHEANPKLSTYLQRNSVISHGEQGEIGHMGEQSMQECSAGQAVAHAGSLDSHTALSRAGASASLLSRYTGKTELRRRWEMPTVWEIDIWQGK